MDSRNPLRQPPGSIPPVKKKKTKRSNSPGRNVDLHDAYNPASPLSYPIAMRTPRKPKVYVRAVFLKIGDIDTLKEQYLAEVYVQARWREPALDTCHNVEDIQWSALWNPQLHLENALEEKGDKKSIVWHELFLTENGEAYVLEKRRVKAEFSENLELHSFPFDVQHLSVLITSRLSDSSLELLEDDKDISSVNLVTFADRQEWDVRGIVETIPEVRARDFSAIKHKFPIITVRTYAVRRAGFYVWNILAITVLICSLALATFAVDRNKPQNRLQLSYTLILTCVAFKFVVGNALPKISYLTVLDKYILVSMLLVYLVTVWHAILTRIDEDTTEKMDGWIFAIFVIIFSTYNIIFTIIMLIKVYIKRRFVSDLETTYQAKYMKILGQESEGRVIKKNKKASNTSRVHSM